MDLFDRATELEERDRADAIRRATSKPILRASAAFCENEDCGEPIPAARRLAIAGCRFCIECQIQREIRSKTQPRSRS